MAARNGQTEPLFPKLPTCSVFAPFRGVRISTDMRLFCDGIVFEITSVEDVKGRGMYIEALAKEVQPSG